MDDEPSVVRGLSKQIQWEHFNMELVGSAMNGLDALALLESINVDLLIADVCMPYMDGLTLISKVKVIQPSLRCIVVSAFTEFEYVKKALRLGVENYLLKPLNDNELQETLSQTLNNLDQDLKLVSPKSPDVLAFRNNILDRWVNRTIQDFELFERAELLDIDLSAPEYMVCVLNFWTTSESDDRIEYSSFLLDMCRKVMAQACNGECFLDSSFRVVFILCGEALEQLQVQLISSFWKIHEEASTIGLKTFISAGSISVTSTHVSSSYDSAVFYQNYSFLDPSAAFIFAEEFLNIQNGTGGEAHSLLLQLNKVFSGGNQQQAIVYVQKIMNLYAASPVRKIKSEILPFLLSLIRSMRESGRRSDALSGTIQDQLAQFAAISSVKSLNQWVSQTIQDILQVIRERKGSFHLLIHLTLEQINKNYHTDLSLKTLAVSFSVSPSYLGHLFKEETGKYFNDFLTEVRLNASITFLQETKMKIGEIVRRVGIPNQSYYNRVFKKTFGVSPLEFRRQDVQQ